MSSERLVLIRTRHAYIATRVLDTPFWAIYNMLPIILYKDLHATPMQLAIAIALKPVVSLLSMYWSAAINKRRDRLMPNILWARMLGYLPFFFFPFFDNPWFFIASFGLYMMLTVGIVPAWMEILKLNVPEESRGKIFAYTQAFGYMGGGILPILLGWALDGYFQAWRWIFPLAAGLGLSALCFQLRMIIPQVQQSFPTHQPHFLAHLVQPWKNAWNLLVHRGDFRRFQIGFMLSGCGLMIMQPVLPVFFVDHLQLSYTELAIALTLCKGIGFAFASPWWSKWIHQMNIYRLSSWVAALACIFPMCLMLAKFQLLWLYLAYLSYGVMQAGSELTWNMSGPIFAKDEDSSIFSGVNVVTVGLRGLFVPAMGTLICSLAGTSTVMGLGALFCLLAAFRLNSYSQQHKLFSEQRLGSLEIA